MLTDIPLRRLEKACAGILELSPEEVEKVQRMVSKDRAHFFVLRGVLDDETAELLRGLQPAFVTGFLDLIEETVQLKRTGGTPLTNGEVARRTAELAEKIAAGLGLGTVAD